MVFGVDGYWDMDWKPICEPWLLYTVIESRYECQDCKRKFWMPSGNFEEIKMGEKISALLTTPKSKEK